ncbi:MAG: hypothetical protein ACUVQ9_02555 [Thermodesulfobacteriota bacterium]
MEAHLIRMADAVERIRPQHVTLDAISAFERMGESRRLLIISCDF